MKFFKTAIFSVLASILSSIAAAQNESIRIDLPAVPGLISTVGNDRYLITDKEEYFLVERMNNPSLLFEINTGKLIATGAEAYKIYAEHTTLFPQPNYTVKKNSKEWALYEGEKKLHSIKLDPYKNSVEVLKRTGIALEYLEGKEKLVFVHPDGKRVELKSVYSNKEKKDPKREVHHRSVSSNLEIGYFYITNDHQYVYDRDGRMINLLTGEINKLDHDASYAQGHVYGSYDPQTSILKVDHRGNIRAIHLRTNHVLGEIKYSYYLDGEFMIPVSIPLTRSNSQLCVMGIGFADASVALIRDNKFVHYFTNPNVKTEAANYALALKKRDDENAERLRLEEAQRQWFRDHPVKGVSLVSCKACNGTGMLGRTAATKANEVSVYEKSNDNYYFKGTSHDTWPIICGACFGRGSTTQK